MTQVARLTSKSPIAARFSHGRTKLSELRLLIVVASARACTIAAAIARCLHGVQDTSREQAKTPRPLPLDDCGLC